jgi:hypothetical protein
VEAQQKRKTMKHRLYIVSALVLTLAFMYGCDEESTEGVSKVTFYATLTMNGEQWNSIPQGSSWTDPGATAVEDGKDIEVVVAGDVVNPNVPGVYTIQYIATNKDGFPVRQFRYVGVISPNVANVDISGDYKRTAGAAGTTTVAKVPGLPNLYTSSNVGGIATDDADESTTVRFYHFDTNKIDMPYQYVQGSAFYGNFETIVEGEYFSWVVINGGYTDATRKFVKQ